MVHPMGLKINFDRLRGFGRIATRKVSKHYSPLVLRIPKELWWALELKEGDEFELFVDLDNKTLIYVKR